MNNNILESIVKLSENEDLKNNFLTEFKKQVNWLENWDEKWENYKNFMNNKNTLELFLEEFNFDFIIGEIKKWFNSSNINQDFFTKKLFDNLDIYFYKKSFEWFTEEEKKQVIELLNKFWELLRIFINNNYDQNTILYKALQENILILNIVFYIILWLLKAKEENLNEKIRTLFWINNNQNEGRIYQYWIFQKYDNEKFNQHLFIISLLVIFIESNNRTISNNRRINYSYANIPYNILDVFNDLNLKELDNTNIYLKSLKKYWLLFNFLEKLENKSWISNEYKVFILNTLLNNNLLENKELLNFSILFTKYEKVKEKYIEILKNTNFSKKEILENLNDDSLEADIINFLLIEWNKKYIIWNILDKLVEIIKNKLKDSLKLDNIYFKLFKNIINWKYWDIKLNLKLDDFNEKNNNKLIKWIIEDIDWFKFILENDNIKRILTKEDIKRFYFELIKNYILENYSIWEEISIKNVRDFFWFTKKDNFVEKVLEELWGISKKTLKTNDNYIIKLIWNKNYERVK